MIELAAAHLKRLHLYFSGQNTCQRLGVSSRLLLEAQGFHRLR